MPDPTSKILAVSCDDFFFFFLEEKRASPVDNIRIALSTYTASKGQTQEETAEDCRKKNAEVVVLSGGNMQKRAIGLGCRKIRVVIFAALKTSKRRLTSFTQSFV